MEYGITTGPPLRTGSAAAGVALCRRYIVGSISSSSSPRNDPLTFVRWFGKKKAEKVVELKRRPTGRPYMASSSTGREIIIIDEKNEERLRHRSKKNIPFALSQKLTPTSQALQTKPIPVHLEQ